MNIRHRAVSLVLSSLVIGSVAGAADDVELQSQDKQRPVRLEIVAPGDAGRNGVLQTTRWPLVLRLQVVNAPAIIETAEGDNGRREALIIKDPDDCIDMRDFPITNPGMPYEPCPGQDELFAEFTSERFDTHDIEDQQTGNFLVRERLVDDPYEEGELLNKPYLFDRNGNPKPVPRPRTGDDLLDGYGYGVDDDLPGLVIMADVGGMRVFDPNFDIGDRVIRNAAGFLNTVSVELVDKKGKTTIHASMHVLAGVFEPIALFDLNVDDTKVDFLRRLESRAVEPFQFDEEPANDDELLEYLVNTYSPVEFNLRAVVVKGIAPEFIRDVNDDGKYTAYDVRMMGYELLSNQATVKIREAFDLTITDTVLGRTCPSRSLIFSDLDGNGEDGSVSCSGTGGARRLRRIPR